jgi:amino acid transporter
MTNMIGVGPFITIPALMAAMGGPQAMLGWFVALVISVADGMMWSELGAAMPGAGGSYTYLRNAFGRETFGRFIAFLFIWQFVVSGPLEIASGFIGFVQYLQYIWPGMTVGQGRWIKVAVGVAAVALLYRRITAVGRITVALWIGALLTVGVVIVAGLFHFDPSVAFNFPPGAFAFSWGFVMGLGSASRTGVYDYLGYYNVCHLGDEVRDPAKTIPRSILISLLSVALIYVVMNTVIISVVPWTEFVPPNKQPLPDPPPAIVGLFMERLFGGTVAKVFAGMVLWTAFGSVFALLLGYSRIPYAAARDGAFFGVFGRLHQKHEFPHISLLVLGVLSVAFSFLSIQTVIDALLGTRILVQFIGQSERPFRMWLYPMPVLVAFVGWTFLFVTSGKIIVFSISVLVAGTIAYLGWARASRHWPFRAEGAGR